MTRIFGAPEVDAANSVFRLSQHSVAFPKPSRGCCSFLVSVAALANRVAERDGSSAALTLQAEEENMHELESRNRASLS